MVEIRLELPFAERIGGRESIGVPAGTVESALHALTDRHPELIRLIWTEDGAINPVLAVFLNNSLLDLRDISAEVKAGDQIDIISAVSGG
jgi:molybdopterin converting factor small subunit